MAKRGPTAPARLPGGGWQAWFPPVAPIDHHRPMDRRGWRIITARAAWVLRRVIAGQSVNGELAALAEPFRRLASHLEGLPDDARQTTLGGFLAHYARPEADELVKALSGADVTDPTGPEPSRTASPNRNAGRCSRLIATTDWPWKGWMASGVSMRWLPIRGPERP